MYGVGGLDGEALNEARWWALPGWLRERFDKAQPVPKRRRGGGWVAKDSGELFESPWRVIFERGGICLVPVESREE
jgi:hypothetical protein